MLEQISNSMAGDVLYLVPFCFSILRRSCHCFSYLTANVQVLEVFLPLSLNNEIFCSSVRVTQVLNGFVLECKVVKARFFA